MRDAVDGGSNVAAATGSERSLAPPVDVGDAESIAVADLGAGGVAGPHAGLGHRFEGDRLLPAGEVADDVDGPGVGRPHGEPAAVVVGVGAEEVVDPPVRALVEQVEVEFARRAGRVIAFRPRSSGSPATGAPPGRRASPTSAGADAAARSSAAPCPGCCAASSRRADRRGRRRRGRRPMTPRRASAPVEQRRPRRTDAAAEGALQLGR